MKVLITGAAGFIGHHLTQAIIERTDWKVTVIDRLDESGNLNRLAEIGAAKHPRVKFVFHDLRGAINDQLAGQLGSHDYILHLAAATHVDRSISDPLSFVYDNVVATCHLLDFARRVGCQRFIQFSTDEVFGPAPQGMAYKEWDRYRSGNPYSATKAGAEELALAYENTYGVPVLITHTMNVVGVRQHPEKFVPMCIAKIENGETVTIHADKTKSIPGSRFYIGAREVSDAVLFLLKYGVVGDKYNIVGERELNNLEVARLIAAKLGKPLHYELTDFHSSRPGHDLRYALDGSKMAAMGWGPERNIEDVLGDIVQWTVENRRWLIEKPRLVA